MYPSNFFRKPNLPVGGGEVNVVIGPYVEENRQRFVERCDLLGRKVVRMTWERSINKGFDVHLVSYGNVGFEYGVRRFPSDFL